MFSSQRVGHTASFVSFTASALGIEKILCVF
jgi:hypothetical protein